MARKKKRAKKRKKRVSAPLAGCLTVGQSNRIVNNCAPDGPHDIDSTLEGIGLISDNLRKVFRECVYNGVRATGCRIRRNQIPHSATTTLRAVRDTIKAKATR